VSRPTRKAQQALAKEVRRVLREAGFDAARIVAGGYALRNKMPNLNPGFRVEVPSETFEYIIVAHQMVTGLPWKLLGYGAKLDYRQRYRERLRDYRKALAAAGIEMGIDEVPDGRPRGIVWTPNK
jgi:hypothetical protein